MARAKQNVESKTKTIKKVRCRVAGLSPLSKVGKTSPYPEFMGSEIACWETVAVLSDLCFSPRFTVTDCLLWSATLPALPSLSVPPPRHERVLPVPPNSLARLLTNERASLFSGMTSMPKCCLLRACGMTPARPHSACIAIESRFDGEQLTCVKRSSAVAGYKSKQPKRDLSTRCRKCPPRG